MLFLSLNTITRAQATSENYYQGAIIFNYFNIGDDIEGHGNLSLEQFAAHIVELTTGDYDVVSLTHAIQSIKNGDRFSRPRIVLTFDNANTDFLTNALPLLQRYNLPFTLFINTAAMNTDVPDSMNWSIIKELSDPGYIDIGIHGAHYIDLTDQKPDQVRGILNRANEDFSHHVGHKPSFLSLPYGHYDQDLLALLTSYSYKGVLGLQSGVAGAVAPPAPLPRFTMTDQYGNIDRFRLLGNALPLNVHDVEPVGTSIETNPPFIGFTLPNMMNDLDDLNCFLSNKGAIIPQQLGANRIEIRLDDPLPVGRSRLNCTLAETNPSNGGTQWRWFGMMFNVDQDGSDDQINNGVE